MQASVFSIFLPTFILVSITPGMCMTLSLSLGMTIGVRRTLWMMIGELVGVGLIAVLSMVGIATLILRYPNFFTVFKLLGGAYLIYLGIQMWRARGRMAMRLPEVGNQGTHPNAAPPAPWALISQGFVTAIANPKGWAFFVAFLPPFVAADQPLLPQVVWLTAMILGIEFISLLIYASGGQTLARMLQRPENVRLINRIAGVLMMGVGVWLAMS